ncbi:hypothetical protein D9756_010964 [Leucocoprinus leucothites]|uniref:Major facilitator superfamily (MFS) profile domain-containing protein n=2 Tax=Leucocoprinus leucothites TaxID=201217 RepID=A0A8H5CT44_9AGAR|nr:hypothetical protein D9756_010964 [Leucoagaricus leucothites]
MATEETPLLSGALPYKNELIYERFSPAYKKFILAIVAWSVFLTGTFSPSIPHIARDLNTTGERVGFAVSLSIFATCIGSLVSASYATFYGRRPTYLISLPLCIIGSIGVSTSRNMYELLLWRFWQCMGASPGLVVGAAVVGDIYKLEERGTGMGIFFAGCVLGTTLAPPVGGAVSHFWGWRATQWCMGALALAVFVIFFTAFPETSHPGTRGIDSISGGRKFSFRAVNPLRPLRLLRTPNVIFVSAAGFLLVLTDYGIYRLFPPSLANDALKFSWSLLLTLCLNNELLVGVCFLPCGLGNMIGAPIAGRISDKIIVKWKKERGGVWYPEDRLRATFFGGLVLVPVSVLGCGLVTEYIEGHLGLVLNLILLFVNGLGVDIALGPSAAYIVDIMHSHSAEAMACNAGFRSFLLAFGISGVMPLIDTYGMLVTNTISACLAWVGFA